MRSLLVSVFVVGVLAFGCKRKPCTGDSCAKVAGDYKETSKTNAINCTTYSLWWNGHDATVNVTQNGNALTMIRHVPGDDDFTMTGTLYDNGTITFGTAHFPLYYSTGELAGAADLTLFGTFKGGAFAGTYTMTETTGCSVNIETSWTRQ